MSDDGASSHDSDGNGDESPPVPPEETLVHGRAKRKTAGNLMSILIQAYKSEDVQNDLVPDEEEDRIDFVASDDDGDIDMESTDESEDEGPPKEGEEEKLEGEKELQKQERVEAKKQKRRAQDLLKIAPMRKKVRVADAVDTTTATDASTPASAAGRPRKKSERTSWLPTAEDAPTRQSLRRATVQNKEQTEVKLRQSQKRSEKAHELLRIAAEKRAADAAPALTQADRIARALETEKENSKSLNRWVQVEEERRIAQRKRMEALRNRQLDGPVVRYWSGSVVWEGDRIKLNRVHQPKVEVVEEGNAKPSTSEASNEGASKPAARSVQPHEEAAAAAVLVEERPHDTTDHPETASGAGASAAAAADHPTDKIAATDIVSATHHPDPPPPSNEEQLASQEMHADPSETQRPAAGRDDQVTPMKAPVSTDPAVVQPSSEPAQHSAPQPASFLDGIHYWATQSPAGSQPRDNAILEAHGARSPSSVVQQSDALPEASATAPAPERSTQHVQPQDAVEPAPAKSEQDAHHAEATTLHQSTDDQHPAVLSLPPGPAPLLPMSSVTPTLPPTLPPSVAEASSTAVPINANQPETITTDQPVPPSVLEPQPPGLLSADTVLASPTATPVPSAPLLREQAVRTLLTLEAFPKLEDLPAPTTATSSRSKVAPANTVLSSILFPEAHPSLTTAEQKYLTSRSLKKKGDNFLPDRPAKASCCITAKEARFRDPRTGLGYRDLAAFKSLQRVLAGGCAWSVQEECWAGIVGDGRMGRVASGVPEGFWSGVLPEPKPKEKEKEKDVVKIEDGTGLGQAQLPVQPQTPVPAQVQAPSQASSQVQAQSQA